MYGLLFSRIKPGSYDYLDYILPEGFEDYAPFTTQAIDFWGSLREDLAFWRAEKMVDINSALGWDWVWRHIYNKPSACAQTILRMHHSVGPSITIY